MMDLPTFGQLARDPFVQTGVLALLGVIVTRFLLRHYPTHRLICQFGLFLMLTALLFYHGIVPYEIAPDTTPTVQRIFAAAAKIVWWINAAWVLTGFTRVFLIFERRPREGRLIQDLVVGLIYLGAALSIVAYVFSAPIGTLIATSGVFAIILGLALQSTLADLFSGIALNFNKPYEVGDWIVLGDGLEGRVVETNWRATHLLNGSNDLVILPNSGLAKAQMTNLSSPNRSHGVKLRIRIAPTMAPSAICEVMRTALLSSNTIMAAPPPAVEIKSLDAHAVELELSFRVLDFSTAAVARHEVFDLVYRHVKASGLSLAPPKEASILLADHGPAPAAETTRSVALRLLDAVPLFISLTEEEKGALAATMTRRNFRKDEMIVDQSAHLGALMIVRNGVVAIIHCDGTHEVELERLAPGDYFGEGGLFAGTTEPSRLRALTPVVVYEVGPAGVAHLLQERPSIADEIGVTLARRSHHVVAALDSADGADAGGSVGRLVTRIRQLFDVAHGA
ncbi:mechanosensitive ion channel domain-containing protein [Reyranella sp.]|uniref:mechanosensitive ion channel domain-containing protein n=1 Tax=Reyranella sp. TaxID=1929291 RepID=UPI003D12FF07